MDVRWMDDTEYDEAPLSKVTRQDNGDFLLERENDWGTLWIENHGFEPKVGEIARFFGKGMGFPVRGVVIAGRVARYQTAAEHEAEMKRHSDEFHAKTAAAEQAAKDVGRTEQAMRAEDAPWPKTIEELMAYIQSQVDGPHTYGTCVYAMSLAATAAFHYVAGALGVTGFQAGCADLDVVRRTRGINGPFMLVKAQDALYPQYDLQQKLTKALTEWRPWLAEQARQRLAESGQASPSVIRHWQSLSGAGNGQ